MPKLLPLTNPEDWRIDDSARVLVHRVRLGKEAVYTLYEIRRVTWASSVKGCLATLTRWLARDPPERRVA